MTAYVVAGLDVTDPEQVRQYEPEVVATARRYGGSSLIRGGRSEPLEGAWAPTRVSILEFPSGEQAKMWVGSPEYAAALGFLLGGAKTALTLVREDSSTASNWGQWLLRRAVHPVVIAAAPLFLLGLIVYFVIAAFGDGVYPGIRTAAAVLLPLIAVTYLYVFQGDRVAQLGDPGVLGWGFVASILLGFGAMELVRAAGRAPVSEVVLSALFSGLVFCYASVRESRVFAYYYGLMLGVLADIVLLGFPTLK